MRKHGKPKENVIRNREKGRPATGADPVVALRLPNETRQAVFAWAKDQPGEPNLSEAIRRLIDIGLQGSVGTTPGKTPQVPSDKPDSEGKAAGAGPTTSLPAAPEQPPKGTIELQTIKGEQTTREVRWTPRVVTPQHVPDAQVPPVISAPATEVPAKAQPNAKPVDDDEPYDMPEDIKAFNDFWIRTEQSRDRSLAYEEIIVLYNRYRSAFENVGEE